MALSKLEYWKPDYLVKGIWWNVYFKALPPEQQLLIAASTPVDRVPGHLRKAALTIVAEHTRLQQTSARSEKESSYQRWITTPSYVPLALTLSILL